jgi:hypothetical protein
MPMFKDRIIRAHGGDRRWDEMAEILACVSVGGWEFTSHFQFNPLRDVDVQLSGNKATLMLSPYPSTGKVGVFSLECVWIEDERGDRLMERQVPTSAFRVLRHWLLWDHLDVIYYIGTLLWQALQFPFLLQHPRVDTTELEPVNIGDERLHRLLIRYPPGMPTVAEEQVLYCDSTGLVRRLDYTPTLYGGSWFKVAQCWENYESYSGWVFATRRVVYPCLASGQAWRMTPLSWMTMDDVSIVRREVLVQKAQD